jgi:hypothetical protein
MFLLLIFNFPKKLSKVEKPLLDFLMLSYSFSLTATIIIIGWRTLHDALRFDRKLIVTI